MASFSKQPHPLRICHCNNEQELNVNMCKDGIHGFIRKLPKVEQHMHIEGSLMPSTLFALAKQNGVLLPKDDPAYESEETLIERYRHFESLDDFLHYYYTGMSVLKTAKDFEELGWAYFLRAHEDGVLHAEVFFDPQAHIPRDVAFETILAGLQAARTRAEEQLGMSSELICCFLRHLPSKSAIELFLSREFQQAVGEGKLAGIGLDSSEKGFPPELFSEVYTKAKELGLRLTAHAGEEGPCENIGKALDILHCERIDHGVRLAEDQELMRRVAAEGTLLTVCPLSEVNVGIFESVADVPIREFLEAGVQFSISSDDPAYLGGYILDNYCAIQEAFKLEAHEWERICLAAIKGSWCSEGRKNELRDRLHHVVQEHTAVTG